MASDVPEERSEKARKAWLSFERAEQARAALASYSKPRGSTEEGALLNLLVDFLHLKQGAWNEEKLTKLAAEAARLFAKEPPPPPREVGVWNLG